MDSLDFCSLPVLQNPAVGRGGGCLPLVPMAWAESHNVVLEYVFWVSGLYGAAHPPLPPPYELVPSSNKSCRLEILIWSSGDVSMAYLKKKDAFKLNTQIHCLALLLLLFHKLETA